ncbi:response regulator [Cyanobacterium sp. IPPAS B-1200]|uniref:response regulator n=1 Tax=Cyanobacterium sp. IPPAS B-1200 TaxID=1562720 RepID=UPI000852646C|nr:response regulator [Cyanobacterium sp. IPPAS B-1200]OEJ77972.1 Fis family transcriptional regulator [Cyanobacterium sp. IPPAS B-1200]
MSNPIPFREFTALKQAGFFENLKQPRFSGQLLLTGTRNKWVFYLYLGRIVYATGGHHPVRRWRRNLVANLPHIPSHMGAIQNDINQLQLDEQNNCWEYELLCFWVDQQRITLEQAAKMIRQNIIEVLFDVTQAMQVTCELKPDRTLPFSSRLVLIDAEQVITEAQKAWHAWQSAKIADRSPDMAPVITQPQELEQQTNPQVYQTLTQLLDGQQTLRDLSVRMKRDVLTVTRSLLPYVQRGLVRLIEIGDIPAPSLPIHHDGDDDLSANSNITIACVDDSPLICQTMEKIITGAGYSFIGINDALRAIAILLAKKPDLIFLDLIMPNANGYEICSQLRKLTFFKHTPIVILTGNDGLVDRVRAKMVGSSDFIGKPVDRALVLETIKKHLKIGVS